VNMLRQSALLAGSQQAKYLGERSENNLRVNT